MKKQFIVKKLEENLNPKQFIKVKSTININMHGECIFEVQNKDFKFYIDWDYSNRKIRVGIPVSVKKEPDLCLSQMEEEDDQWCGNPHHLQLNPTKTKVQRIGHRPTWLSAPDGWFLEKEYEEVTIKASFSEEEINEMAFLNKSYGRPTTTLLSDIIIKLSKASRELYW